MKAVKLLLPAKPTNLTLTEQEVSAYLKKHHFGDRSFVATLADVETWRAEPSYDRAAIDESPEPNAFNIMSWGDMVSFVLTRELEDAPKLHEITVAFQWLSRSIYTGLAVIQMLEEAVDRDIFLLSHKFRSVPLTEKQPNHMQLNDESADFRFYNKWEHQGSSADNSLKIIVDISGWGETAETALAHYNELEKAYRDNKLGSIFDALPAWLGGK